MRPTINKDKSFYLDVAAAPGLLVAFTNEKGKTLSGMIIEIEEDSFLIETKNGTRYVALKTNVLWVKTGGRWPKGIYQLLKKRNGKEVLK